MKKTLKPLLYFLLISLLFTLTGCGPKSEDSVKGFLDSFKKYDFKTSQTYILADTSKYSPTSNTNSPEQEKMVKGMLEKISYEIVSSKVDGDNATVTTKITSPDMLKIMSESISTLLPLVLTSALSGENDSKKTEELIETTFLNNIKNPNAPLTSSTIDIKLVKTNGEWKIKADDSFLNALTGNLYTALKSFGENMNKQMTQP